MEYFILDLHGGTASMNELCGLRLFDTTHLTVRVAVADRAMILIQAARRP